MPSDEEQTLMPPGQPDGMQVAIEDVIEGFKLQAGNAAEQQAMNHAINKKLTAQLAEQADQIMALQAAVDDIAQAHPEQPPKE